MKNTPKIIRIDGQRWFDKLYGNTYFSSRIYLDGKLFRVLPMQYGYGDSYLDVSLRLLKELKIIPDLPMYELRDRFNLIVVVRDGKKSELDMIDPSDERIYELQTPYDTVCSVYKKSLRAAKMYFNKLYSGGMYHIIERDGYGKFISSTAFCPSNK